MLGDAGLNLSDFLGRPRARSAARATKSPPNPLADLGSATWGGRHDYALGASALRALRMARVLAHGEAYRRLAVNPALRAHVAAVAPSDPLFWLSHGDYLARGLDAEARTSLALSHYGFETARFDASYLRRVYAEGGLTLWQAEADGVAYDVRLMPGHDVLYEGGLSVVLHVNGGRVCVLSFSWAPERIARGQGGEAVLPFVTRKQLAGDQSYQAAFGKAFGQIMPANLCLAAVAGLAGALGQDRLVGIAADRHPAMAPQHKAHLARAYDEFWAAVGGDRTSPLGYVVELPFRFTPLEQLDRTRRRRAVARRSHMEVLRRSAHAAIEPHIIPG